MSMRATFTTDFIYDTGEGYIERENQLCNILGVEPKNGTVIGQISWVIKGVDLSENDIKEDISQIVNELQGISMVDFKIVWLLEAGDIIVNIISKK